MKSLILMVRLGLAASLLLSVCRLGAQAGPPFQTDDPTPVDLGHYEFYVFGAADGTPATKMVEFHRPREQAGTRCRRR